MTTDYDVFGNKEVAEIPPKRAAYSDRTALLMAQLSLLAYRGFEKGDDSESGYRAFLDATVDEIKSADNDDARERLVKYLRDADTIPKTTGSARLDSALEEGGLNLDRVYVSEAVGTEAFIAVTVDDPARNPFGEEKVAVLCFRGTTNMKDWLTNAKAFRKPVSGNVKIHAGFLAAFRAVSDKIRPRIKELRDQGHTIYITGHSLGGALAIIATREIGSSLAGACYTFGSPRVAGSNFGQRVKTPIYRVVNANDIVPRLPTTYAQHVLLFFANIIPFGQSAVEGWLNKLTGYIHHGDMRYLKRTSSNDHSDIVVLSNPDVIRRMIWFIKHPLTATSDHSIHTYCAKLEEFAEIRSSYK